MSYHRHRALSELCGGATSSLRHTIYDQSTLDDSQYSYTPFIALFQVAMAEVIYSSGLEKSLLEQDI